MFDQAVHPVAHVIDDNGPVCRKRLKIPLLGHICPAEGGRELDAEHQQQRQHVRCAADEQPGDEVHNGVHLEQREHLTVDHFALAAVRHLKRLVDPADDKIQHRVKHQNQPVAAHREMHPQFVRIESVPNTRKRSDHKDDVYELCYPDGKIMEKAASGFHLHLSPFYYHASFGNLL